ncbi:MAG: hypothetical protein Q7S42_05150 [Candidatus Omnitrophota bacterium]|nr:hypothetical protein [Candidatus Omnitrophota bacterium]
MKKIIGPVILLMFLFLAGCSFQKPGQIKIIDAKMAASVDEKLMPQRVTSEFPQGTTKVFCWLSWKNATVNTPVIAKWHYITDDVHILDYTINIPRKEGTGSISLVMPEGKPLPTGQYKVELFSGKRLLKTITFNIR